jgi:Tol biopolymer transport system component
MRIGSLIVLLLAHPLLAQTTKPIEQETLLSDVVQLTSGFARAGEAYFSSDMQWMIFQGVPKGEEHYQMYLMQLTTKDGQLAPGSVQRISPENSRNTCGYFSPDGKTIIFASTVGKEHPDDPNSGYKREGRSYVWSFPTGMEIYRCDNWQSAWQARPALSTSVKLTPLTNNDVYDAECAFSPDGKWICFTRGAGKDADIYVMRADGTGDVKVVAQPGYDGGPFFSPDGKRLVYRSDRKGNDLLQIFVADLTFDDAGNITGSKDERQLTDDANVNWGPYWHPDGKHIVYATSKHGHANYELYLMQDDGSNPTRVTFWNGADVLPTSSPDGKWLLWTSKRTADQTTQVFAARFKIPD